MDGLYCFNQDSLRRFETEEPYTRYCAVANNKKCNWYKFLTLDQVNEEDISLIKEVDSAIAAYEKSGRIPSSVIEAAIFRKPYFVNKFLPILLKPR